MNLPIYSDPPKEKLYILLQITAITKKDWFNDPAGWFLRIEIWYQFSGA